MVSVLEAIEQFPKTLEEYSERAGDREVQRVATDIGRIKNLNPPVYNERGIGEFLRGRATHLKQLVDDYFVKSEHPIEEVIGKVRDHIEGRGRIKDYSLKSDSTFSAGKSENKKQKKQRLKE